MVASASFDRPPPDAAPAPRSPVAVLHPYGPRIDDPSLGTSSSQRPLGGWFVLGAGIAVIAGSFMSWVTVSAPFLGTVSTTGVERIDGWITAVLGLLIVVCASLTLHRARVSIGVPILAVVVSLAVTGLAAWQVLDLRTRAAQLRTDLTADDPRDSLGIGQAISDSVQVFPGTGVRLIIFAGLVAAGAAALIRTPRRPRQRTSPPAK